MSDLTTVTEETNPPKICLHKAELDLAALLGNGLMFSIHSRGTKTKEQCIHLIYIRPTSRLPLKIEETTPPPPHLHKAVLMEQGIQAIGDSTRPYKLAS